jgi:kynureninase
MAALEAAMDVWDGVDMEEVRRESLRLGDRFIAGVERACPELVLATPREHERRGSQVSFRHPEGYAVMQALIARGWWGISGRPTSCGSESRRFMWARRRSTGRWRPSGR